MPDYSGLPAAAADAEIKMIWLWKSGIRQVLRLVLLQCCNKAGSTRFGLAPDFETTLGTENALTPASGPVEPGHKNCIFLNVIMHWLSVIPSKCPFFFYKFSLCIQGKISPAERAIVWRKVPIEKSNIVFSLVAIHFMENFLIVTIHFRKNCNEYRQKIILAEIVRTCMYEESLWPVLQSWLKDKVGDYRGSLRTDKYQMNCWTFLTLSITPTRDPPI